MVRRIILPILFGFFILGSVIVMPYQEAFAVPPDQISDLALTVISSTQVDLAWSAPSDGGSPITSYQIFRNLNGVGFVPLIAVSPISTSYSDTTLSSGDAVTYGMKAVNDMGVGDISNIPPPVTTNLSLIEQILADIILLFEMINQEITDRITEDTNLQTSIDTEQSDRITADTDLQSQIDTLFNLGLVYYVSQDIILPPGDFGSSWFLTCDPSELIVSGGAEEIQFATQGIGIAESYPLGTDSWVIRVDNNSGFEVTFNVWIVCIGFLSETTADLSPQVQSQEPRVLEAKPIQKQMRNDIQN